MKVFLLISLSLSLLLLAACSQPAITPVPAPPLPAQFANLPVSAKLRCIGENVAIPTFPIWELPAVEPGDKNSAYQGNRGKKIDVLKPCEIVTITKVVWSEYDGEWYLLIRSTNAQGWIYSGAVEIEPTPHQ